MAVTRGDLLKAWTATSEYDSGVSELMWVACWRWCTVLRQVRLAVTLLSGMTAVRSLTTMRNVDR
jgi:hypothetical protein